MIPENIIKLVESSGYWPKIRSEYEKYKLELPTARETIAYQELMGKYIYLNAINDPLFWQALGKAKGWEMEDVYELYNPQGPIRAFKMTEWRHKALNFFDLLMTNGDTAAYWDNLK